MKNKLIKFGMKAQVLPCTEEYLFALQVCSVICDSGDGMSFGERAVSDFITVIENNRQDVLQFDSFSL